MSLLEAIASTAIGFAVSWALTFLVLPYWGFTPSPGQALHITLIYTGASLLRSWAVRAAFRRAFK